MMRRFGAALLAAGSLVAAPAMASDTKCVMSYETFEAAVPHIDLEQCPAGMGAKDTFCRASFAEELHVFVFSENGDRCLVSVHSLPEEKYTLAIK